MKKRILTLLIALTLILPLFAAITVHAVDYYPVTIANEVVSSDNCSDVLGDGVFSYDPETNVLTVSGDCDISDTVYSGIITQSKDLTIYVAENSLIKTGYNIAIDVRDDITFTGPGTLVVRSESNAGIYSSYGAKITLEDANLTVDGDVGISGTPYNGQLLVRNSYLYVTSKKGAVTVLDDITVEGCSLYIPSGGEIGDTCIYDAYGQVAKTVLINPVRYDLYIAGVQVAGVNASDVLGDGIFSYDPGSNTLTVKGDYGYDDNCLIISNIDGLTVRIKEDSELDAPKGVIASGKDITITGPGELTMTSEEGSCIFASNGASVTIDNASLDACGQYGITGFLSDEKLVIKNSTVFAIGNQCAIGDFRGGITLDGVGIYYPDNGRIENGSIVDEDGQEADFVAVLSQKYDLFIDGVQVTLDNCADILGNGVFSFDPDGELLYVEGEYTSTTFNNLIHNEMEELTVILKGDTALYTPDGAVIGTTGLLTVDGMGYSLVIGSDQWVALSASSIDGSVAGFRLVNIGGGNIRGLQWGITGSEQNETLLIEDCAFSVFGNLGAIAKFTGGITLDGSIIISESNGKIVNGTVVNASGSAEYALRVAKSRYDLYVGGTQVTLENKNDILGNGMFSYDADNNVLTVKGGDYSSASGEPVIDSEIDGLTVKLEGKTALRSHNSTIRAVGAITVDGGGYELNLASVNSCALYASGFEDSDSSIRVLNVGGGLFTGKYGIAGENKNEKLTVEDSAFSIEAVNAAICDFGGGIILDGSDVRAPQYLSDDLTFVCEENGGKALNVEIYVSFVNPFVDVKGDDYFYKPVKWAVLNNVTKGTDETHFSPNATCTRAQVVTFLWRAIGSPEPKGTDNPFKDVKEDDYYYKAVLWAVENGITAGTSASTFSPNAGCTRAQVVTFLWRAEGEPGNTLPSNPFVDVKDGEYYYPAVMWAVENNITKGTDETHFSPNATCTRAQIVTFLHRDYLLNAV